MLQLVWVPTPVGNLADGLNHATGHFLEGGGFHDDKCMAVHHAEHLLCPCMEDAVHAAAPGIFLDSIAALACAGIYLRPKQALRGAVLPLHMAQVAICHEQHGRIAGAMQVNIHRLSHDSAGVQKPAAIGSLQQDTRAGARQQARNPAELGIGRCEEGHCAAAASLKGMMKLPPLPACVPSQEF